MATGGGDGSLALILKDFEHWLETTPDAQIFLLQVFLRSCFSQLSNIGTQKEMFVTVLPCCCVLLFYFRFNFRALN